MGGCFSSASSLFEAVKTDDVDQVARLIEYGANVNATTTMFRITALMRAAGNGSAASLALLLRKGAKVNATDSNGWTALIHAALSGHAVCLGVLLKYGADVRATGSNGRTALRSAAELGKVDCLRVLLKRHGTTNEDVSNLKRSLKFAQTEEIRQILRSHIDKLKSPQQATPTKAGSFAPPPPPVPSPLDSTALNSAGSSVPPPSAPFMTIPSAPSVAKIPLQNHGPGSGDISHQSWIIPFEELQLGRLLGKGSYAEVYSATWHGTEVAAKRFTFPGGSAESEADFSTALLNKIKIEADLLASVRHPHVVAFLAMCTDPPCMVTELCSEGSVFDTMKRCKNDPTQAANFTWGRRLNMLTDAAAGMSHLHQRKPPILHRDLKSLNLLVDSAWRVKIADLGLSKLMEEVTAETHAGSTASSMNARWLASEVLETGKWLPASDVYAFGVIMWELLTWELPWNHINQFMIPASILKGDALPVPTPSALPGPKPASPTTLDRYIDLLKKCMDKNPSIRPSFLDIAGKLRELAANESKP